GCEARERGEQREGDERTARAGHVPHEFTSDEHRHDPLAQLGQEHGQAACFAAGALSRLRSSRHWRSRSLPTQPAAPSSIASSCSIKSPRRKVAASCCSETSRSPYSSRSATSTSPTAASNSASP